LLRELRLEAGLRQEDVAERLRRPQSYVSNLEAGDKTLDFLEVKRLCGALGIGFVDFVRRFETGKDE
jgi:transcriptional regulator with XRE-family HTH domain